MRQIQELSVERRPTTGKGPSFRTRSAGHVPAIVYGGKEEPLSVCVDAMTLKRHVENGSFLTTPFMLTLDGKKTRVIPRALQLDPVSDRPVHVDFMRLAEGGTVRLAIPVRIKGQENSPGIKRGGVLNIVRHTVELICPVDNIPDYIEGDMTGLEIHGSLSISDFQMPKGVKPATSQDFTVASIVAPTHIIEEQRAAAAAAAAAALAPPVEEEAAVPAEGAAAVPGAAAAPGAPGAAPAAGAPGAAGAAAPAAGGKAPAGAKAPEKEKK